MQTPKWFVIAKNEYRVLTSRFRGVRPQIPFLVTGFLAVYVAFIAPRIVGSMVDGFTALLVSQVALAVVEILLLMMFLFLLLIPISNTLREDQTRQMEIVLAAPVRSGDVLMGEYLGRMPLYAVAITLIAGLFTALLGPLGISLAQKALIIAATILVCLPSFWIGNVLTAMLKTMIARSKRIKDLGRGLSMLVALPLVAVFYAMINGVFFDVLADPVTGGLVRTFLGLLPSSWGAEIIVGFALNPGNMGAVGFLTLTRFGGLLLFFGATLALGWRLASRAYSLEAFSMDVSTAKPDGFFYKSVKAMGGSGSFGTLLVSVFKDWGRRMENLSQVGYMIGLMIVINIFLIDEPEFFMEMSLFLSPVLGMFIAGEATLRGKEALFIYRKTPSGVSRFIKARLVQAGMVVIPVLGGLLLGQSLLAGNAITVDLLLGIGNILLIAVANVAFGLGVALLNPAFSMKSGNFMVNIQIVVFGGIATFFIPRMVFHQPWLHLPLAVIVGVIVLFLGARKLRNIE